MLEVLAGTGSLVWDVACWFGVMVFVRHLRVVVSEGVVVVWFAFRGERWSRCDISGIFCLVFFVIGVCQ